MHKKVIQGNSGLNIEILKNIAKPERLQSRKDCKESRKLYIDYKNGKDCKNFKTSVMQRPHSLQRLQADLHLPIIEGEELQRLQKTKCCKDYTDCRD